MVTGRGTLALGEEGTETRPECLSRGMLGRGELVASAFERQVERRGEEVRPQ